MLATNKIGTNILYAKTCLLSPQELPRSTLLLATSHDYTRRIFLPDLPPPPPRPRPLSLRES